MRTAPIIGIFLVIFLFSYLGIPALAVAQGEHVAGDLAVDGDLHLQGFRLLRGGVLEFPGKLWFKQ